MNRRALLAGLIAAPLVKEIAPTPATGGVVRMGQAYVVGEQANDFSFCMSRTQAARIAQLSMRSLRNGKTLITSELMLHELRKL